MFIPQIQKISSFFTGVFGVLTTTTSPLFYLPDTFLAGPNGVWHPSPRFLAQSDCILVDFWAISSKGLTFPFSQIFSHLYISLDLFISQINSSTLFPTDLMLQVPNLYTLSLSSFFISNSILVKELSRREGSKHRHF